jgi:hypothetical protein
MKLLALVALSHALLAQAAAVPERHEFVIAAFRTEGGDYETPPAKGLEAFGMVWAAWLHSQEWWRRELWRASSPVGATSPSPPGTSLPPPQASSTSSMSNLGTASPPSRKAS